MKTGPLLTVNAISQTPVIALTVCKRITVMEDASVVGAPTSAYQVAVPGTGDGPLTRYAGVPHVFVKPDRQFFTPGEYAGYLELVNGGGSTKFSQLED